MTRQSQNGRQRATRALALRACPDPCAFSRVQLLNETREYNYLSIIDIPTNAQDIFVYARLRIAHARVTPVLLINMSPPVLEETRVGSRPPLPFVHSIRDRLALLAGPPASASTPVISAGSVASSPEAQW